VVTAADTSDLRDQTRGDSLSLSSISS